MTINGNVMIKTLKIKDFKIAEHTEKTGVESVSFFGGFDENIYRIHAEGISGDIHHYTWEHTNVTFGNLKLEKDFYLDLQQENGQGRVKLYFSLKGQSTLVFRDTSPKVKFECNQHNLIFLPANLSECIQCHVCKDCSKCEEWKFLEITMDAGHFEKYMGERHTVFEQFKEKLKEDTIATFCPNHLNVNLPMQELIENIIHCQKTGIYKRLFIESQTLTLLSLQLEQLEQYECPALFSLKKVDIDKMYMVRDILCCNMDQPCPLVDLALQVGTNECTLKKGFKEVFGCTVHGYLSNLRMQHAKKEILETNKSITEIAEEIGYKNATHFTAAFKRKFGVIPSKLRS